MITYDPLWRTMKNKKVSTYTLREKYEVNPGTIQRLRRNDSVSTYTLNAICRILNCGLSDIAEYIPDEKADG